MEVIETVEEYCPQDCIYRMRFTLSTDFCAYLLMTDKVRGCKVSECDKYRSGHKRVVIDKGTLGYRWVITDEEK